jgi:hypothetical protein
MAKCSFSSDMESHNIAINVQLILEDNKQGQEADILFQHRNSLYVLELKADLPHITK